MPPESGFIITGWFVIVRTGVDNRIETEYKGPMPCGEARAYAKKRMRAPHCIATVHPLTQAV